MLKKSAQAILLLLGLAALGVSISYAIQILGVKGASVGEWASAGFVLLMGLAVLTGAIWAARKIRVKPGEKPAEPGACQ
jgi:hypothetical protein